MGAPPSNVRIEGSDSEDEDDSREYGREELLSSNPFILANFSKRKIRYMALFDVEQWAAKLKAFTFLTATAAVDMEEAVAVQHYYQEGICGHRNKITNADEQALGRLCSKIAGLITELKESSGRDGGFFVRLGPRSPKDAPMFVSRRSPDEVPGHTLLCGIPKSTLQHALDAAAQEEKSNDNFDACGVLCIFQSICYRLLRVSSGEEAVRLLISSSRVMQDISHTLDHGANGWSMSVVAREWDKDVRLEREFRTFVIAGAVTAISQYDDQLTYPFVKAHSERIVSAVLKCVSASRPQLQDLSANLGVVVDVLVVPPEQQAQTPEPCQPESEWQARIIELNPFGPMTGASLFSWTGDRRLLQGGRDVYGDLEECERQTPAGSVTAPPHVGQLAICGVPFRYVAENPPGFNWDQLQAYWEDYYRLAPEAFKHKCRSSEPARGKSA